MNPMPENHPIQPLDPVNNDPTWQSRMNARLILIAAVLSIVANNSRGGTAARGELRLREKININRDWKFHLGDCQGAQAPGFADADWTPINLPHSFDLPYFMSNYYVGYGWYRKIINVDPAWSGKRINLEFLGAFQDAEVFVNGTAAGRHRGGFTGFNMDITAALHPGSNLVAVRLNNIRDPQLEPIGGDHTFMGGIYRDVYLVITAPLHVTWYGTFVTTPSVSDASAVVNVKTEVKNESDASRHCVLKTALMDPNGRQVAMLSASQEIPAGATATINQTSEALDSPLLWSPDHPSIYEAVTTLCDGTTPVDDYQTSFWHPLHPMDS